jgi:hypothetical protein
MSHLNRRTVLNLGLGALAAATMGKVALVRSASAEAPSAPPGGTTEVYKGRRIVIAAAGGDDGAAVPAVLIDDRSLHVMRVLGDQYVSSVNHYQPRDTVAEAARGAVDALRGRQLSLNQGHHHN